MLRAMPSCSLARFVAAVSPTARFHLARAVLVLGAVVGLTLPATAGAPAERLATALTFETISHQDPADFDPEPFLAFHAYVAEQFPAVHATLERELVADYSLLYTWPGSDPSLAPLLVTAHHDVVPVAPGTEGDWEHPAFGGVIADGWIWGRGALDDKVGVLAALEAVERLITAGFSPRRTLYLAFGHDEEIGGDAGAGAITALLDARGVRLWMSLDEGMAVVEPDGAGGFSEPIAMVGIAEKGFLTLRLVARAPGGHSSVPPPSGAIGRLARAAVALEANPMPARFDGAVLDAMRGLADQMGGAAGFALRNADWLGFLVEGQFSGTPMTNAMIRTTTAVTIFDAGVKANVLPPEAALTVNFRIIPGDTVDGVVARVREIIADPEIEIEIETAREPSEAAPSAGDAWDLLAASIAAVHPGIPVMPALVVGGTDTKHYGQISDAAYRFTPFRMGAADAARIHGTGERVRVDQYEMQIIPFYEHLIRAASDTAP